MDDSIIDLIPVNEESADGKAKEVFIPSGPIRILPADAVRNPLRREQRDLLDAYRNLARAVARVTTEFHEEEYHEPNMRSPYRRPWLMIPRRKPSSERQRTVPRLEDILRVAGQHEVEELDMTTKETVQHQVIDSIIEKRPIAITGVPEKQREHAQRYAQYVQGMLQAPLERFLDALPRPLRERSEAFFDGIDLHEHFTNAYLYALSDKRIIKPEFKMEEGKETLVNARTILPLTHYLDVLAQPDSWWAAKYLHYQFRKFSTEKTLKTDIKDWFARWVRIKAGSHPDDFIITADNADEYAVHRLIQEAPGLAPHLEEMAHILDKYRPGTLDRTREGIKRTASKLGIRSLPDFDRSEVTEILEDSDVFHYDPVEVDKHLEGATPQEREFAHWFAQMMSDTDKLSVLQKHLVISPLVGWNVSDDKTTEENVRQGAERVSDKKHALCLRDSLGHMPVLEDELNRKAGRFIFGLTHEAFLAGSAALHEVGKDAREIIDTFSKFTPLSAQTQERLHNLFKERLGFVGRRADAFERLRQATYARSQSVVKPNKFGGFVRDHRFSLFGLVSAAVIRNAWDHGRKGRIHTFVNKTWNAVRNNEYIPYFIDILQYSPEDAHRKDYGAIETDELPASLDVLDYIADARAGIAVPEKKVKKLYKRLGNELLTHEDNIFSLFATGLLLKEHGRLLDAQEQFLDVKGWIELSKEKQFEDADRDERIFLHHQLLSATEYYLADMYRHTKELPHIEMLRRAYKQYKERRELVQVKSEGGPLTFPSERKIYFDLAENEPDNKHDLMLLTVLSPLNFRFRRKAIEVEYAMGDKKIAQQMLMRAYSDMNEIGAVLSVKDVVEAKILGAIGAQHNYPMPDYLRQTLANHANHDEADGIYTALPAKTAAALPAPEAVRTPGQQKYNDSSIPRTQEERTMKPSPLEVTAADDTHSGARRSGILGPGNLSRIIGSYLGLTAAQKSTMTDVAPPDVTRNPRYTPPMERLSGRTDLVGLTPPVMALANFFEFNRMGSDQETDPEGIFNPMSPNYNPEKHREYLAYKDTFHEGSSTPQ